MFSHSDFIRSVKIRMFLTSKSLCSIESLLLYSQFQPQQRSKCTSSVMQYAFHASKCWGWCIVIVKIMSKASLRQTISRLMWTSWRKVKQKTNKLRWQISSCPTKNSISVCRQMLINHREESTRWSKRLRAATTASCPHVFNSTY